MRSISLKKGKNLDATTRLEIRRLGKVILFHPRDNVAVALQDLKRGETFILEGQKIVTLSPVPKGHKVAIKEISRGSSVVKLGVRIGAAKRRIAVGEHVHIHNLKSTYTERR